MTAPVTLALDLGTTSVKAALLGENGGLTRLSARAAAPVNHHDGRYESDAQRYFDIARQLLEPFLNHEKPVNLGLCSQRSSFVVWDRASGKPVTPLVSWQDNRGAVSCSQLQAFEPRIQQLTGLRLTPYYFAPKVRQLFLEQPDLRTGLERGTLLIGTLDCFMIWRLTQGACFQTDVSMAARTLLMDRQTRQWSETLCDLFGIPRRILPRICPSSRMRIPLARGAQSLQASLADQSAAVIAGIRPGSRDALINLGTGGFVVCLPAAGFKTQQTTGYLHTLICQAPDAEPLYAVEGTLNSITAALAPYPFKDCDTADLGLVDAIFCIPEPSGLGAPYFLGSTGVIFSEPVTHLNRRQVAGLLLEGIIFRVTRILEDFQQLYGINRALLAGGLTSLPCIRQGIAACSPVPLALLLQHEASLLGAALLAGGLISSFDRTVAKIKTGHDSHILKNKYLRWKRWFDDYVNA